MTQYTYVRPATLADVGAIAGLLTQLNAGEGYSIISEPDALAAALFADVREVNLHAFVAEHENEIIGTLLYYAGYDTLSASVGYHLADMVVDDSHRRAGVGKALMQALANITQAENKAWVSLTAMKDNAAAQAFYSALGMTRVDVDFFAIGKTALTQM